MNAKNTRQTTIWGAAAAFTASATVAASYALAPPAAIPAPKPASPKQTPAPEVKILALATATPSGIPNFLSSAQDDGIKRGEKRFVIPMVTGGIVLYRWQTDKPDPNDKQNTIFALAKPFIFDLPAPEPTTPLKPAKDTPPPIEPLCAVLNKEGSRLAVSCSNGKIYVYDVPDEVTDPTKKTPNKPLWATIDVGKDTDVINAVAFTPNSQEIITARSNDTVQSIQFYKAADKQPKPSRKFLVDEVETFLSMDVNTGSKGTGLVACGSKDGKLVLFDSDPKSEKEPPTIIDTKLPGIHKQPITAVKFSPDGENLVSLSKDAVVLWNAKDGRDTAKITANRLSVREGALCAAFITVDKDDKKGKKSRFVLLVGYRDGSITVFDYNNPIVPKPIDPSADPNKVDEEYNDSSETASAAPAPPPPTNAKPVNPFNAYTWPVIPKPQAGGLREIYGFSVVELSAKVPDTKGVMVAKKVTALAVAGTDPSFRLYDMQKAFDVLRNPALKRTVTVSPMPVYPPPPPAAEGAKK